MFAGESSFFAKISVVGVSPELWDRVHEFDTSYEPPAWDILRLDALPAVGTAIVLAATALEVFIAHVLDVLASTSPIPADVWEWLNDRRGEPSVEEQFDFLLHHFVGQTLKDNNELWIAFLDVKRARNAFVHQGTASLNQKRLEPADARRLVNDAFRIIDWVIPLLPTDLQKAAKPPKVETVMQFGMRLFPHAQP